MPTFIAGIGTAVPPNRIAQAESSEIVQRLSGDSTVNPRLFQTIYRRSGVGARHSVVLLASDGELNTRQEFFGETSPTTLDRMKRYEQEAAPLAIAASSKALQEAQIDPKQISHLITVSCTGFYSPGFDIALIKELPLSCDVLRTHVGFMGCHAFLNALRVAKAFVEADPSANVLVCAVELCSLHLQYGGDPEKIVANALFADGAGALVATSRDLAGSDGYQVVATGSTVIADTEDAMSWKVGDHGFEMTLSSRVPDLIGKHLRPWLDHWLERQGQSVSSIGSWAVHPGGPRILSAFAETAEVPRSSIEASYSVLNDYGNMSSPTILFILDRLRIARNPRPCVALAFGPGLTVEAALLK